MKGTLKSKTATITMSRDEYIALWCHLTKLIKKNVDWNLDRGFPLTTNEKTCQQLGELLEKMYNDWYEKP